MSHTFTIRPEHAKLTMQELLGVHDVRHVAVIDAIGLCLAHVGREPVSNALLNDWTVVAKAAFGACDQLGQRSGMGHCEESVQKHENGGTILRTLAGGMLLVVQHGPRSPLPELLIVCKSVAEALPTAIEVKAQTKPLAWHPATPVVQEAEIVTASEEPVEVA